MSFLRRREERIQRREERRAKRRLAREIYETAAIDVGVSNAEFAAMVLDKDDTAVMAIGAAKDDLIDGDLDDLLDEDWSEILQIIIQIALLFLRLMPLFAAL